MVQYASGSTVQRSKIRAWTKRPNRSASISPSLTAASREAAPLLAVCLLVLIVVAAIPAVTLLLPHAMLPVN